MGEAATLDWKAVAGPDRHAGAPEERRWYSDFEQPGTLYI